MVRCLLALLAIASLSACEAIPTASPDAQTSSTSGRTATVTRVLDGDTFAVGKTRVRPIGVDTPESVKLGPNGKPLPPECFGVEASDYMKTLLPEGTPVLLVYDEERKDYFGRDLAYVYRHTDGLFINKALVEAGVAEAVYYSPNGAHRAEFEAAEKVAQAKGLGLWGACG